MKHIKENANYCLNCKAKPCSTKGCPLNNNIPGFIKAVKEENYKKAYRIISDTTVLPGVCRQNMSTRKTMSRKLYKRNKRRSCCNRKNRKPYI